MHGERTGPAAALPWARREESPVPVIQPAADASESRLADRALAGDRQAWGVLIERHDRVVVLSLLARGVRLAQARDLSQQAWLRLMDQQRAGRLTSLSLPGLAIRQAAFLALEAARPRGPETLSLEEDPSVLAVADPAASAEERLISREELTRAREELARCSPAARRVFDLVYADPGVPHADAARRLGLSVQRLRQTLCEVRARLRKAIETEPSHE